MISTDLILFLERDTILIMRILTIRQKEIARLIQKDIPVDKFPFRKIAERCAIHEKDVLKKIKQLLAKGFIRRFGAILRHQKTGYTDNALVVWSVNSDAIEKTGNIFASFPFISHCYQREPAFMGQYNLFTMLHAGGRNISSLIKDMVMASNIKDYLILKSEKEYKKTSPEYFT